ncbi:exonuclease SbcD [Inquilinus ginsengisoli]|uniref:metallophosphoesterase family protein n=1 Tax=Inquilinus ginsengisoli TaxID=363840 RepID=UPI003D212877
MRFTFLHAADLHLGSPLTGLGLKDAEVARRFASASREAFSDLVTRAIEAEVAFVVIAGDVYDGEWRDTSIGLFFNREVARLDRAGIPLYLLKGNHDAESVVTKTISLPDCVSEFPTGRAGTFRIESLKVALHGRGFPDRAVPENYALGYPDPVPGWVNIGVLHTSCDGRPGHAAYAPCTVQDLASRGYQYWALGHVHEYEELSRDPWIVYPGNLQGRSVRECGPKGAVLVDVADGHIAGTRRLALDRARWAIAAIDLTGVEAEAGALRRIEEAIAPEAAAAEGRLLALRVRLTGSTPLHRRLTADPDRIADEVQAAANRIHEDIWLERLRIETVDPHPAADDALAALDLSALLGSLEQDPQFQARAAELVATVASKLPGGIASDGPPFTSDLGALLEEARAMLVARASAGAVR